MTEEEKFPERYFTCIEIPGHQIYESVINVGLPAFLVYDFKDRKFFLADTKPGAGYICHPLPSGGFPYRPYTLEMDSLKNIDDFNPTRQKIFDTVYKVYDEFLDLKEEYITFSTATTLETYEQHKISSLGYPFYIGDNESGKTRALEIHLHLDYRPMLSANLPAADVYNYIGQDQEGTVTILEDDAHELTRKYDLEKLKLYRVGYKKGAVVPRIVEPTSKKRTQIFYRAFCSKIFAGRYVPNDRDLKQRLIEIPMVWGNPKKDELTEEDILRMDKIKLGLLVWRMRFYNEPLTNIETEIRRRPKELWKSKLQIVAGLKHEQHIRYLSEEYMRKRTEEKIQSLEGYITKTLLKLDAMDEQEIQFSWFWRKLLEELGIPTSEEDKDSVDCPILGYKLTKHAVGARLHSVFDGESFFRADLGRTWKFKKENLDRLKRKFYIK